MKTRKELQDEYKLMKFKIGVFKIKNTANGKFFLGSNINLDAIWNRYKFQLELGKHYCQELQADWNKFGADAFVFEILAEVKQKDDVLKDYSREVKELEEMYWEEYKDKRDMIYNKL